MRFGMQHHTMTGISAPARRLPLFAALFAALACIACTAAKDTPSAQPEKALHQNSPLPETASIVGPAVDAARPRCDEVLLTTNAVGAIHIDDRRDSVRARCTVRTDSTEQDGEGMIDGK